MRLTCHEEVAGSTLPEVARRGGHLRCAYDRGTTDWRTERAQQIRALIEQAEPDVVEEVKWRKPSNPDGVPTFAVDGLVCTLETYKDKVKVTFAKGASLPDPAGVFNASLQAGTRRAVDVHADDEIDADAFVALVREAAKHNRG